MQDITRFTSSARNAPNVRNSTRLTDIPSSLPSRRSDASEFISSMNAEKAATSRLIMLKASPIDFTLAKIADVTSPSGNRTYATQSIPVRNVPPRVSASSIFMRKAHAQNTAESRLTISTDVLQRNLRTPSDGAIILL